MTYHHQSSRVYKSKNTTKCVIANSVKDPENCEIDATISRPSCVSLRAAKVSSSPPFTDAIKASTFTPTRKPVRRRKTSRALTTGQVRLIKNAALHAVRIGVPFNRFITINWELAGVIDVQAALSAFLKALRDWLQSHGYATAYVWVQERGPACGVHSHILIYVPPSLIARLGQRQRGWLKKTGVVSQKGVVHSRPIAGTSRAALSTDPPTHAFYRRNLNALVDYIAKGADAKARHNHGIKRRAQYSVILGKRAGTSRNVGAGAIKAFEKTSSHDSVLSRSLSANLGKWVNMGC